MKHAYIAIWPVLVDVVIREIHKPPQGMHHQIEYHPLGQTELYPKDVNNRPTGYIP